MRLALLGDHPETLRVARSLVEASGDQLCAAAGLSPTSAGSLLAELPGLRLVSDWESFVESEACDAVLIGGANEVTLNGARQLAANGKPLLFVPDAAQGSAFIYELSLIHDDNNVALMPVLTLLAQPLVGRLRESLKTGTLGRMVLLRLERGLLADRSDGMLSREVINGNLLPDVLLLRALAGGYSRITAVHSGTANAGVSMATVTLGGEDLPEATWIARVADPVWTLIVSGTDGEAVLNLDLQTLRGELQIKPKVGAAQTHSDDGKSVGRRAIEQALEQRTHAATQWLEMTRGFETVEATATSLRRRRTIDMHFETTSERSIFKSQMAAGGCSLLLLTLVGLVAFLLLGAFLDSRSLVQRSAEATGRIIQTTEFEPRAAELNRVGKQHVIELARRLERSPEPIFVMPESAGEVTELDRYRVAAVKLEFRSSGHESVDALVDHAQLPSVAVQWVLRVLRVAWIAPLMIFLLLQGLLFVARPSTHQDPT